MACHARANRPTTRPKSPARLAVPSVGEGEDAQHIERTRVEGRELLEQAKIRGLPIAHAIERYARKIAPVTAACSCFAAIVAVSKFRAGPAPRISPHIAVAIDSRPPPQMHRATVAMKNPRLLRLSSSILRIGPKPRSRCLSTREPSRKAFVDAKSTQVCAKVFEVIGKPLSRCSVSRHARSPVACKSPSAGAGPAPQWISRST